MDDIVGVYILLMGGNSLMVVDDIRMMNMVIL